MAGRKKKPAPKGKAAATAPAPARVIQRRDIRPYVYLGLNQLFVIIYFYVLTYVIPNRFV